MRISLLPEAELEATEAAIRYEDLREGLGGDFLTELRGALARIRGNPQSAALLESYTGPYEIRRHRLKRFPYLVIYSCWPADCIVLAVSHERREPFYWLDRLGGE